MKSAAGRCTLAGMSDPEARYNLDKPALTAEVTALPYTRDQENVLSNIGAGYYSTVRFGDLRLDIAGFGFDEENPTGPGMRDAILAHLDDFIVGDALPEDPPPAEEPDPDPEEEP